MKQTDRTVTNAMMFCMQKLSVFVRHRISRAKSPQASLKHQQTDKLERAITKRLELDGSARPEAAAAVPPSGDANRRQRDEKREGDSPEAVLVQAKS